MSKWLFGKVCIITETGSTVGRAAAQVFVGGGALVVGCDPSVEAAQSTLQAVLAAGGKMVSMQPCNLNLPGDCRALVELAISSFGRIDVLFTSKGMTYFDWSEGVSDEEMAAQLLDEVVKDEVVTAPSYWRREL